MTKQQSITELVPYELSYPDFTDKFLKKGSKEIIEILESRDDEEKRLRDDAQEISLNLLAENRRKKNCDSMTSENLQDSFLVIEKNLFGNLSRLFEEKVSKITVIVDTN